MLFAGLYRTGKLLHLRFCEAETTFDYQPEPTLSNTASPWPFTAIGIQSESEIQPRQQDHAIILNELNIDIIFANSPQAK